MPLPLPLPLGSSKQETKKSQSSKIVPSDHGQSEKRGEKYPAKRSLSSPQGPLKKRSALEDLTNASQSQPAQPKKEASKGFVKGVSKTINRTKPTLKLAKNNEMNIKQYEVGPSSVAVSTPMVLHTVKKPCTLKTSTISEIPTTEEPSLIKKTLDSKEKPTTGDTVLNRRSLSLKKHINQNNISIFEKPLTLLEETESDLECILEPVTFEKKQKTEEAVVTQSNLSFKEMCTCQGKQSCYEKEMILLNINVEKDFFFMEPMNFRKKPESEEATPTKRLLTLNKCATQEKMSNEKKPLILKKATSGEESLIEKPLSFEKTYTTEEFCFQETSLLQEKHTPQGEVSILKKPLTLQKTTIKKKSLLKETLFFKKKRNIEEATATKELVILKKKCTDQDKISCLKTISEAKAVIKEPSSFKKKPTAEEEFLFKESPVLPEKHTTQEEVSILKKPLVLQKTPIQEESHLKESVVFKKKLTIEEATGPKELVLLKKKCTTQDKIPCLKKPLILQTISEEKSVIKESLPFKKKPATKKEFLFKESSVLPEKHTTQGEVALSKKTWVLQENIHSKDEFLMEPVSLRKKHTVNEAISSKELISLKKKECATQIMMSICQVILDLQNIINKGKDPFFMGPASLRKKSSIEEAVLVKTPLSTKKKQLTQGKTFLLEKPLVLDKTTSEKGSLFKKALHFKKKPKTDEEFLWQDPCLLKEDHTTLQGVFHSKKPLALQEKTTMKEKPYIKEASEKKPITEEEFLFQEPFSLHVKPTNKDESLFFKCLNRQSKMYTKEDSLKKLLTLQEKSTTEKDSLFKKSLVLKKKLSNEATTSIESQLSLKKKPTALVEVNHLKKQLSLQKNTTNEEFFIKRPLTLQEKPSVEKESFHGKSTINEAFRFKMFSLNEKPTTRWQLSFEEPLALQNNPTHREDTFLKDVSIQFESSPHVFSTTSESRTGMSSSGIMSSVSKFNTAKKPSDCESGSNKPFLSCGKRSQKEITPLEDIGKNHNNLIFDSVYIKDIFRYLKEREEKFILKNYMSCQSDISSNMRAILVNWLVSVQITFKLNHETLYLAVKLVDHYLMKVMCKKDKLQLLGSTAFMIAAKFEESCPPYLDEFLYICNDAYQRDEMLAMEMSILKTLEFDINIPVAYHFLRRYSVCFRVNMNTLLLSRFICEMTLQEYDYIQERASKLAAGSFLLALYMKNLGHLAPTLEYYSGYKISDLHPLVKKLNILLTLRSFDNSLKAVHSKYSHRLFFEVTKIPPLNMWNLEEILNSC